MSDHSTTSLTARANAWRWAVPGSVVSLAIALALAAFSGSDVWIALLLGAVLLLCGVGVAFSAANGLRPVALAFFAFVFSWLGVAPVYQLATGNVPWGDASALLSRETVIVAIGLTVIAVASFWFGTLIARRSRGQRTAPPRIPTPITTRPWVAWMLIGAAVVISPIVIAGHGGVATFFGSRLERDAALIANGITLEDVGGAQYAVVTILPVALSIAAAVLVVERLRPYVRRRDLGGAPLDAYIAMAAALALLVLYANPFTNSRFIASLAFGALALAVFRPRSRPAASIVTVVTLVVVLIAYPVAELFRDGLGRSSDHFGLAAFGTYDFDGFLQLTNTIEHVDTYGHSFGWYLVSALAFAVPRSVWSAKAQPASIDVAEGANYQFTNLSLPIHGELFLEFGIVGVVIGMALIGWAAARIDSLWLRGATTRLTVLAPILAMAMLGLVRGPLGSLVPVYGAAIVFVWMGLRRRRSSLRDASGPTVQGGRGADVVLEAPHSSTLAARAAGAVPDALGATPGRMPGDDAAGAAPQVAHARKWGLVATHAHPESDDREAGAT